MKKKPAVKFLLFCLLFAASVVARAENYKIGVLAKRGAVKCMQQWKATADYLTAQIPGDSFEIMPLDFDDVFPAVEKGDVDFFLVNSSMFVTAKVKYGASSVATMINSRQGQALKLFGGVIFTSAYNDSINSLEDLKGKSFMGVKDSSFGGWQMAYKEFMDAGIDPYKDFSKLEFGGKHDNVVFAVENGVIEAGTVRTDTLERMAAEGSIELDEFKVLAAKQYKDFPFMVSTALYPEWPLAKVSRTSQAAADRVASALLKMSSTDKAAKYAKIVGWSEPLDYSGIEALQQTLKVGAYKE